MIACGLAAAPADDRRLRAASPLEATSEWLYSAGCASLAAGDTHAATCLLRGAVVKQDGCADFVLKLAEACVADGQKNEALRVLRAFVARQPHSATARFALAQQLCAAAQWHDAADVLLAGEADLDPEALRAASDYLSCSGRIEAADALLQRAVARFPDDVELRLTWIDAALRVGRPASALDRIREAEARVAAEPRFSLRAAMAFFRLNRLLGAAEIRTVAGGVAGQFRGDWLLIEPRPGQERFYCCPRDSAMFQVRRALDGGLDEPAVHVLHARIWLRIGQRGLAYDILKAREVELLQKNAAGAATGTPGTANCGCSADTWHDNSPESVLNALAELALAADEIGDYLRYAHQAAEAAADGQRSTRLALACATAAERYALRGDAQMHRELLHRAAEYTPSDANLLSQLADAEWAAQRKTEAAGLYRRVLRLAPDRADRTIMLERISEAQP